jgi:hypothetical protein
LRGALLLFQWFLAFDVWLLAGKMHKIAFGCAGVLLLAVDDELTVPMSSFRTSVKIHPKNKIGQEFVGFKISVWRL